MIARLPAADDDALEGKTEDELSATLREVREFMDDPIALMERALELLKAKRNDVATWLLFGVLVGHLLMGGPILAVARSVLA